MPVISPIIHLNGDRPQTLIAQLEHAYTAVSKALLAVQQCAPNARNYYPIPGRYEQARDQHEARLATLLALRSDLSAECQAIQAQAPERRQARP